MQSISYCMVQEPRPMPSPGNWWRRIAVKEADRDRIGTGERIGSLIGIIFIIIVAFIFLDVQGRDDVFFTDAFGPVEQVAFYGSLLYGIVPGLIRAIIGQRNLGRLADVIGSLVFALAWMYLLTVFPFDFSQLWDYLPEPLGSALSWVSDDLIKLVMAVGIIISIISAVYNLALYLEVRRELRRRRDAGPSVTL